MRRELPNTPALEVEVIAGRLAGEVAGRLVLTELGVDEVEPGAFEAAGALKFFRCTAQYSTDTSLISTSRCGEPLRPLLHLPGLYEN